MKKLAISIAILAVTIPALAAQAIWTGAQEQVQTVSYRWVWKCEYDLYGQKFWRLFESGCPGSIEVF